MPTRACVNTEMHKKPPVGCSIYTRREVVWEKPKLLRSVYLQSSIWRIPIRYRKRPFFSGQIPLDMTSQTDSATDPGQFVIHTFTGKPNAILEIIVLSRPLPGEIEFLMIQWDRPKHVSFL